MRSKIINFLAFFCFIFIASEIFGNNNIVESRYSYFVGKLGASWQFPSDHLPRGATVGNFFIYSPDTRVQASNLSEEILNDLVPVVQLLTVNQEAQTQAQTLFQYFLDEVALDAFITRERQDEKVQEFKILAENLTPEVASILTNLLLEETHVRIIEILQDARLDELEIEEHLADNEEAILRIQNMDVETARQMLFFVAELKIHRQYIYEFGIALGAPEKQLLRHDLCKLHAEQFEAYVRYFRGGRQECDKSAFFNAWAIHQHEEHHLESYSKDNIDNFSDEHLQNNMLEATADMLAATKQRGGGLLTDWLVNVFSKTNPHPRLIPFLGNGLRKAHAFYLESVKNSDSDSIFKGLPCWNNETEEVFRKLAGSCSEP